MDGGGGGDGGGQEVGRHLFLFLLQPLHSRVIWRSSSWVAAPAVDQGRGCRGRRWYTRGGDPAGIKSHIVCIYTYSIITYSLYVIQTPWLFPRRQTRRTGWRRAGSVALRVFGPVESPQWLAAVAHVHQPISPSTYLCIQVSIYPPATPGVSLPAVAAVLLYCRLQATCFLQCSHTAATAGSGTPGWQHGEVQQPLPCM
jgi:hypothetical protein